LNKTKILFICGSLEPSKDGVGDYTRRLCGELSKQGYQTHILSIYDKDINSFTNDVQIVDDTEVSVSRIPKASSYKQRLIWVQKVLEEKTPDWVSLQFVPYSFNSKGLPFWLPHFLKQLKGSHQWHIMFHEVWVGIEKGVSFRIKSIGFLQKIILKKINNSVHFNAKHTQSKVYQYYLSKNNIDTAYLPLFGNIAVNGVKKTDQKYLKFIVFATVRSHAPFEEFIADLKKELVHQQKQLIFIFIGNNGPLLSDWTTVLDKYKIAYEVKGRASESEISHSLLNSDFGISSTPYKISDKSGVVAAMLEHNLPIINVAKEWEDADDIDITFENIVQYHKGELNLSTVIEKNKTLNDICDIFLKAIDYEKQ